MSRPGNRVVVGVLLCLLSVPLARDGRANASSVVPPDTPRVEDVVSASATLDSLRVELRRLEKELKSLRQDYADRGDLGELLDVLAPVEDEEVPEDTRSRRKRLNDLLKALTDRPGQLRFNGGATAVAQYLDWNDIDEAAASGSVDLYAHTSYGPGTLLFFAFEAGNGRGVDRDLPFIVPLNGDAVVTRNSDGMDLLVLNEAWAEFTVYDEAVSITAGKIDLTNYFDINRFANDETTQFLSGAFVNSAAFAAPDPGPGVRLRTVLLDRFAMQLGVVSADTEGGSRFEDVFPVAEVGLRLLPDSPLTGNLRGYVYAPAHVDGATGWGLSLDQNVARQSALFARWGENDGLLARTHGISSAWSLGFQQTTSWLGRQLILGTAYGVASMAQGGQEDVFEVYGSWQVNTWTLVSPHIQVLDANDGESGAAVAGGVRMQFFF